MNLDHSDQIILSLLGDKTYQLLAEKTHSIQKLKERALSPLFGQKDQIYVNFDGKFDFIMSILKLTFIKSCYHS